MGLVLSFSEDVNTARKNADEASQKINIKSDIDNIKQI